MLIAMDHMFMFMFIVLVSNFVDIVYICLYILNHLFSVVLAGFNNNSTLATPVSRHTNSQWSINRLKIQLLQLELNLRWKIDRTDII